MSEPEVVRQIRADVAWMGGDGRFVALTLSAPESLPLLLADSAALVWQVLTDGPQDESDIVARVAAAAGVETEVVAEDVAAFLRQLERLALVARTAPT
ncbi:PqqD family peptide modification chaperone [Ammonicoccus fulvus]|uniref:PqqD family peptide modification chaperone n=1 Tax=Ammonicoccus fulvus TaxID=3138240 RepID=A0ABZ3FKF1_9ACTN